MNASPDKPLAGRIAFVTGATRGIGRATALALAKAGAHVIAVGPDPGRAGRTGRRDQRGDRRARDPGAARPDRRRRHRPAGRGHLRAAQAARRPGACGRRAGRAAPVAHIEPKAWDEVIATNLTSIYRLIRSFEPLLRAVRRRARMLLSTRRRGADQGRSGAPMPRPRRGWRRWCAAGPTRSSTTPVRVVLIEPRPMRTRCAPGFPGRGPDDPAPIPSEIGPMIVELARGDCGRRRRR